MRTLPPPNGPGPGMNGEGGDAPAMYCQSEVRNRSCRSVAVGSKCGVRLKPPGVAVSAASIHWKLLSEFHCEAWPQPERPAPQATFARTDQFCTIRPVVKKLPAKRRNFRIVPLAVGVDAKLTHGPMTVSSSQFLITKPPGPNAMLGSLAIVGPVSSVHR